MHKEFKKKLKLGGRGGGSPQSTIGVYTLAPKCDCAHNIGYVCVFVHITECARWSTEHHQGRCVPLLLAPKVVSATFTGGVSPVPPTILLMYASTLQCVL